MAGNDKKLRQAVRSELSEIKKEEQAAGKKEEKKRRTDRWVVIATAACVFASVLIFGASLIVFRNAIAGAARAGWEAFTGGVESKSQERLQEMGRLGYENGLRDFKTVNDVTIRVDQISKTARLEVMKVSSVVFIHDTGGLDDKVAAWLKVSGEGIYTVDMAAGEYLVDNTNRYVLVRVPAPTLGDVRVTGHEKKLFRDNSWFPYESPGDGVELAMNQLALAQNELTEDIKNNAAANAALDSTAVTLITALVRSLNQDIPELTVQVEFF